jgi:hypothetical protein
MVRTSGFPAKKVGGIWVSNADAIIDWTKRLDPPAVSPAEPEKDILKNHVNPQKTIKNTPKTPKISPKLP